MKTRTPQADHMKVIDELAKLDVLERDISGRRNQIHRRIDSLRLKAPLDEIRGDLLEQLEAMEQDVSRERRELHSRIDEVRKTIGLPPWREQHHHHAAW